MRRVLTQLCQERRPRLRVECPVNRLEPRDQVPLDLYMTVDECITEATHGIEHQREKRLAVPKADRGDSRIRRCSSRSGTQRQANRSRPDASRYGTKKPAVETRG